MTDREVIGFSFRNRKRSFFCNNKKEELIVKKQKVVLEVGMPLPQPSPQPSLGVIILGEKN